MPATYEPISTTTLGSAVNSVTLSSIPATYTDLVLVWKGSCSANGSGMGVRFNGDSGTNYSENQLAAAGATAYQSQETSNSRAYFLNSSTNTGQSFVLDLINYANTTTYKSFLVNVTGQNPAYRDLLGCGMWRNTAAINSITIIIDGSTNFTSGSIFTLYGILAA